MSQFTSRFQSPPSNSQHREADMKLHTSPEAYTREAIDSVYSRRHQDTQKIKNLSFWENTDLDAADEEDWAETQSTVPFILVMVILAIASTLLWFAFQWASGENAATPPTISAETEPFKIRPHNPGGMMIPHQDKLVYGRLSQDAPQPVERLLPLPEKPVIAENSPYHPPYPENQGYPHPTPPPSGYAPPPAVQGAQPQALPQHAPQYPYPPLQGQPTYSQQQPPLQKPAPYPAPHIQPSYGPSVVTPPAVLPVPVSPSQPVSSPVEKQKNSAIKEIRPASDEEDDYDATIRQGQKELDQLIAKEAEKPLKPTAKKVRGKLTGSLPQNTGKYKVQIASLPSRTMAENEMKRLRSHHHLFFENKPWRIQKVNLGSERGITHRLIVGSFPNRNAAAKFCKKLRTEKIGCLVVDPE